MMFCVIDTHALVWFLEADLRLSEKARDSIMDPNIQIIIPTIVLAEISHLYNRKRTMLSLARVFDYIADIKNCIVYPLDEDVVQSLPTSLDIHDGIIVATALVFRDMLGKDMAVITNDVKITISGIVKVIW